LRTRNSKKGFWGTDDYKNLAVCAYYRFLSGSISSNVETIPPLFNCFAFSRIRHHNRRWSSDDNRSRFATDGVNHALCNRQPLSSWSERSVIERNDRGSIHLRFMDSSAFQTSCDIGRLAFPKYQTANHVAYLTSQLYTPSIYHRADRKRLVTRSPRFHVLTQWSTIHVIVAQKRERERKKDRVENLFITGGIIDVSLIFRYITWWDEFL